MKRSISDIDISSDSEVEDLVKELSTEFGIMTLSAAQRVLSSERILDLADPLWKALDGAVPLVWYNENDPNKAVISSLMKHDFEALSPQSRARFAWMFWSDIEEDGERHFDDDQVKVLKRGGCWLCIPYVISDVTLTTFRYAVTRKKNRADSAKSLLREAGSIAIEDAMGFAKDYQVEVMEELVKELQREKRPRTGPGNLSESVQGAQAVAEDMVDDRGESPLTEAEETVATESVRSTLIEADPGFALFRVNIMSATPLQNVIIMYHQAGVDVRWRTVSDLMERFSKLGITVLPRPLKYGKRVEGGTEVAHYGSLKKHLETEARRIGHAVEVTIVSEKNRETILSTAINTEDYLTYNVGYTDLRISAAVAGGRRHASKSTAVTREVKTEASGKKKEELAAQVALQYVGNLPKTSAPPLATGGDPGSDNQVLAMVTKRGRTAKSSQEFCLDLFAGIPADLAMLFECQWAAKAQQFAGGNLSVFSQDIIDGYRYMKSVIVEVSRSVLSKAYLKALEQLPEGLSEDLRSDAVWDGIFAD